jgi:hypothetical protein
MVLTFCGFFVHENWAFYGQCDGFDEFVHENRAFYGQNDKGV